MPTQQHIYAFESYDHLIPCTTSTKANSLAEWTEAIFIKPIFIVLAETVFAELSVTDVFFINFCVVLIAVSSSNHIALRRRSFDFDKKIFTFRNLCDVGINIWCWLNRNTHLLGGILAFGEESFRVE